MILDLLTLLMIQIASVNKLADEAVSFLMPSEYLEQQFKRHCKHESSSRSALRCTEGGIFPVVLLEPGTCPLFD